MKRVFSIVVLLMPMLVYCQTASISGKVFDKKTKEAMIGATVLIAENQTGTSTDLDGFFEIKNLAAGEYTLTVSSVGYSDFKIEKLKVENGKNVTIDVEVEETSQVLDGIEIVTRKKTDTESSVIAEIKKLQNIVVGVSSQQITKSQDRDASQIVRRIPGISIFDDRFIIVRGLNERYNTVLLNEIIPPSTEVDVKSFSFDLIPSAAVDRLLVYKSPSADLPGDMSGGAIKIYTKTVPDNNFFNVSVTGGFRNGTTGKDFLQSDGFGSDLLPYGAQKRALPNTFPSTKNVLRNAGTTAIIDQFKGFNNYYDLTSKTALPDLRANINFGRTFRIGSRDLSNVSYLAYSNTNQFQAIQQNRFLFDGSIANKYQDNNIANNVRIGAMSNWSLALSPKTRLEFRNLYNQIATKESTVRSGQLLENGLEVNNQSYRYEQRGIFSSQLGLTKEMKNNSTLVAIGGFGFTNRYEPDFRRFTSSRPLGSEQQFKMDLQQFEAPTLQQAARFWSNMNEFVFSGNVTYEKVFGDKEDNKDKAIFKTGMYSEYKDRYFKARWFGMVNPNRVDNAQLSQDFNTFFNVDNLKATKFYYAEGTNFDDKYTSQNALNAAFVSLYKPITDRLKLTVGMRAEYNQQYLQSKERGAGQVVDVNNSVLSPLPSMSANYMLNEKSNIRAAYGITVNRPEFRELAPFTYYDFNFDVSRRGNKDIKNANIQNVEVRYEYYPNPGETITFGAFYKKFKNPIEAALFYNGSNLAFTVTNSESAISQGIELEVKKNLTDKIQFFTNMSLINSNVKVSGLSDNQRYLQGQSPYMVNSGLFYNDAERKFQFNLLYNVIGKRIYVIGDNVLSSNVFEMPRNVIDFNISKSFEKFDIKLGVNDLLNQSIRLIQDTNRDSKIDSNDGTFQEYKRGSSVFLTINKKF